jgi:gluconokinase
MGVTGSGKSTVGRLLARRVHATFVDADDLHPAANVTKMSAGRPLDDADRAPWLRRVRDELAAADAVVVACSALKRDYRDVLREAGGVVFVFLDVGPDVVADRVGGRRGHFMKTDMVASQFADLERPGDDEHDVLLVDADRAVDDIVDALADATDGGPPDGG